jgi:hypothetical protein
MAGHRAASAWSPPCRMAMCGRPPRCKKNFRIGFWHVFGCCHVSGLCCGEIVPRARMGVRGSGPHHWSALEALPMRLVLLIPSHRRCAIPILCPSYAVDSLAITAAVMRRRPELGNFHPWPSAPTRCGRSCWPAPRSPASAACARAFGPATNPWERRSASPSAPPRSPL